MLLSGEFLRETAHKSARERARANAAKSRRFRVSPRTKIQFPQRLCTGRLPRAWRGVWLRSRRVNAVVRGFLFVAIALLGCTQRAENSGRPADVDASTRDVRNPTDASSGEADRLTPAADAAGMDGGAH